MKTPMDPEEELKLTRLTVSVVALLGLALVMAFDVDRPASTGNQAVAHYQCK